jgi:hypothetical protein
LKGTRTEATEAIDALKLCKGGSEVLWRLLELNNIDKHRAFFTAGVDRWQREGDSQPCPYRKQKEGFYFSVLSLLNHRSFRKFKGNGFLLATRFTSLPYFGFSGELTRKVDLIRILLLC